MTGGGRMETCSELFCIYAKEELSSQPPLLKKKVELTCQVFGFPLRNSYSQKFLALTFGEN